MRTATPTLQRLRSHLVPGQAYRRAELMRLSSNVDRHLAALVAEGRLKKLRQGLYLAPKSSVFGEAPPDEESLLRSFLKDARFVVYSPNQFNSLGLGTTQLYNERVVFNRKRVGTLEVGGRQYTFRRWREAPKALTEEFLLTELLNRLDDLAEDRDLVLERLRSQLSKFNVKRLSYCVDHYGTVTAKNRLRSILARNE